MLGAVEDGVASIFRTEEERTLIYINFGIYEEQVWMQIWQDHTDLSHI